MRDALRAPHKYTLLCAASSSTPAHPISSRATFFSMYYTYIRAYPRVRGRARSTREMRCILVVPFFFLVVLFLHTSQPAIDEFIHYIYCICSVKKKKNNAQRAANYLCFAKQRISSSRARHPKTSNSRIIFNYIFEMRWQISYGALLRQTNIFYLVL